jgi:hypothetical protein
MRIRNTRVAAAAAIAGMAIGIPSAGAVAHHLITVALGWPVISFQSSKALTPWTPWTP